MNSYQPNIIERAFQLAPGAESLQDIRKQLSDEGYLQVDAHLQGPKIRADLRKILRAD